MKFENIEFRNVEEMTWIEEKKGYLLKRVKEKTLKSLSERGKIMMLSPVANVEMRFFMKSNSIELMLSTNKDRKLLVFIAFGDYIQRTKIEICEETTVVNIEINERLKQIIEVEDSSERFSKKLVRVLFAGTSDTQLYYHGIKNGEIDKIDEKMKPGKTLLSYGTSITHGAFTAAPYFTYPYVTAANLGMDLINLGVGGACFLEKAITDHLVERNDFDIMTLSISVNMVNNPQYTLEDFIKRATYMVNEVGKAHKDKQIFCITLFPFFNDVGVNIENGSDEHDAYRQALRDIVNECGFSNVHLIEGNSLLKTFSYLTPDLIHPSEFGLIEIGNNLARQIKDAIQID